jgi:hypothetical protein
LAGNDLAFPPLLIPSLNNFLTDFLDRYICGDLSEGLDYNCHLLHEEYRKITQNQQIEPLCLAIDVSLQSSSLGVCLVLFLSPLVLHTFLSFVIFSDKDLYQSRCFHPRQASPRSLRTCYV